MQIAIEPESAELVASISAGLDAFNALASGRGDTETDDFFVTARDADGRLTGGAYCSVYWDALFVKWLWLEEAARGKGVGRSLMLSAETEGARRGARMAHLDTFGFQAPAFYEKLGYATFGRLEFPGGRITRFYMSKLLGPV
jgi:GNAT superfamily N-acetyltransferase